MSDRPQRFTDAEATIDWLLDTVGHDIHVGAPLGLGKVQLADGRWETGFICDAYGLDGAEDITRFGGWKAWLASRN